MEYAELDLYTKQGGEKKDSNNDINGDNIEKLTIKKKQNKTSNYEKTLKLYKKKIIEQRNEIERLNTILERNQK